MHQSEPPRRGGAKRSFFDSTQKMKLKAGKGQVFWLGLKAWLRLPSRGRWHEEPRSTYTATGLRGICTRLPFSSPGGRPRANLCPHGLLARDAAHDPNIFTIMCTQTYYKEKRGSCQIKYLLHRGQFFGKIASLKSSAKGEDIRLDEPPLCLGRARKVKLCHRRVSICRKAGAGVPVAFLMPGFFGKITAVGR